MRCVKPKLLDRERKAGKIRGPLHGIPVIIKDNIDLAGAVTTAGSLALAGICARATRRWSTGSRAAGAIVIAKANLSEWANFRSRWSWSGWSAVGGLAVNPHDPAAHGLWLELGIGGGDRRAPCAARRGNRDQRLDRLSGFR